MSGFAGHPRLEVKKGKLSRIWIGVVVLMMFVTWSYCLKETMAFYIPVKLPFQKSQFRGWSIPIQGVSLNHACGCSHLFIVFLAKPHS